MTWNQHAYNDIPGTYVFDGKQAHGAYALNKLLFSLNDEESRRALAEDPEALCDSHGVIGEQREAFLNKDFLKLLQIGANVYYLAKWAIPAGISVQDAGAAFQGVTSEEFKSTLLKHGENLEARLNKIGGYWNE